ncbi:peroxin [Acrasis kona]|uniref:Peroxin-7 n=1 Tax=Acrasis kona TaxID=1008807 RepID=A0AAW2ZNW0_9EUKA
MNGVHIQKLEYDVNDVQFSTYYQNVFCCGTFDYNGWFHDGNLYVLRLKNDVNEESRQNNLSTEILAKCPNKIGINAIVWSEKYVSSVACANHDGSVTVWDVNKTKRQVTVQAEKGHALHSIDWNHLDYNYLLCGSASSRVKLFDLNNFEIILATFAEHSRTINDVKWNNNNRDEFATVSEDGLCKIWDRRSKTQTSVNTLLDRKQPTALKCCDWHKRDDWLLAVGNIYDQVVIWDTRNSLQPLTRRYAHGSKSKSNKSSVTDIKFDFKQPDRLMTCADDRTVRVWNTKGGTIYLTNEHLVHREKVHAVDWNPHDPDVICSASADGTCVSASLSQITQVNEFQDIDGQLKVRRTHYVSGGQNV